MATFDGFFTGEVDALETYLKTKYTATGQVFQGKQVLGTFPFPGLGLVLGKCGRDPKSKFGWVITIDVWYVQQKGRLMSHDVWDEAEVLMDHIKDHWSARNVADKDIHGIVDALDPIAVDTKKYGYVHWVKITSKSYKLTDEG
jgi:hypothetical protein